MESASATPRLAESGYGWGNATSPSVPSVLMRAYLGRPRERLMAPFEDPWALAAILRAADRRLGRACLLEGAGVGPRAPGVALHETRECLAGA